MSDNITMNPGLKRCQIILIYCFIICFPVHAAPTSPGIGCGDHYQLNDDPQLGAMAFFWPGIDGHLFTLPKELLPIFVGRDYGAAGPTGEIYRRCFFNSLASLENPDSACDITVPEVVSPAKTAPAVAVYLALIDVTNLKYCAYTYQIYPSQGDGAPRDDGSHVISTARPPFILKFEEPILGGVSNGIANVRGWLVSDTPIVKVDLYIDGVFFGEIPYGGVRALVAEAHPSYPNANKSGFSMAYGFSNLSRGEHTMQVRAYDASGLISEQTNTFSVVAFNNRFIEPLAPVNLETANFIKPLPIDDPSTLSDILGTERFRVNNAVLDGISYNLLFEWHPATQKFEMIQIDPLSLE